MEPQVSKILSRSSRYWTFEKGALPTMRLRRVWWAPWRRQAPYRCLCGKREWQSRYWLLHSYEGQPEKWSHRHNHRCDVSLKCMWCGLVDVWGVVVSDEHWERYSLSPRKVNWHEWDGGPLEKGVGFGADDVIPKLSGEGIDLSQLAQALPKENDGWQIAATPEVVEKIQVIIAAAAEIVRAQEMAIQPVDDEDAPLGWSAANFQFSGPSQPSAGFYRMVPVLRDPRVLETAEVLDAADLSD
jgi:hypothetical protein